MGLNPKQQRFVAEYLIDLNATQAAIRAGYSEHTAGSQGHDLLKVPEIAEAVAKRQKKLADKVGLTAEYILNSLMNVADKCQQAEPVLDYEGEPTGEYKFDSGGANRALELLGKHLKLFTDKIEVDASEGLAEAIAKARARRATK